ncbi:bifunctional 3,4-dihydroxy-2-butanone-4-phosphate synthase/GTP cyclohydrolase II [bacterium]|jgi:3,4-dihydroxy 2-butanone 4-phosphate synthase/GTP cyclohydrolase II|nr:bifunctional 3,4-dihydroxy-2-butanone-4-phosphate synthase/GTP cyclohydrolase II [bacterium]
MKFNSVEEIISELKEGRMVILVDDENRENEGDLVMAAEKVSPETINFMLSHGKGLICVPMSPDRIDKLNLDPMVRINADTYKTAFTVSVDARNGVSTGISAFDRAKTIKLLADDKSIPSDFVVPGHIFPLKAREGGVLVRAGHTEAAVDYLKLAGLNTVGVICEILNPDGSMARLPELEKFAGKYKLKISSIENLIKHRHKTEKFIRKEVETDLPTKFGIFKMIGYSSSIDGQQHVALIMGKFDKAAPTLVRVHSECLTGDVFKSMRCDCGSQLEQSMQKIAEEKKGVILYMRQEGRGIGLINKLKAYSLQDKGYDTVEANIKLGFEDDLRDYGIGAQILEDIGVGNIILLTNNPRKIVGLEGYGIKIVGRKQLISKVNRYNRKYLLTKKNRMGHFLNIKE